VTGTSSITVNEPNITNTSLIPDVYNGTQLGITLIHPYKGIHLFYIPTGLLKLPREPGNHESIRKKPSVPK
jgi:hypothetical protein